MAWGVAVKLGAIWIVKKVFVLGAVKAYGPGKLYRKTLKLNKYMLSGVPMLQRGGSRSLGLLFRLPDMILGKHSNTVLKSSPAGVAKVAQQATSQAAAARAAQRQSSAASSSTQSFAAGPLMKSAEAAKNRVYSKLPSKASIQSSLRNGGYKARSVITSGRAATRALISKDYFLMRNIQQIRSTYGQTYTLG